MTISFYPSLANVNNDCGGGNKDIEVAGRAISCQFQFSDEQPNWYSLPGNEGRIRVAKKSDPNSYCTYHYSYTYHPVTNNYSALRSENITLESCAGNLSTKEISVVNDQIKSLPRPLSKNAILNIDLNKAYQLNESLAQADCGGAGGNNCLIAAPDLTTTYTQNGSTLSQSLALQAVINRYEPFNFEQFLGSHNAVISRQYTNSNSDYNLSYSDPDNYLSLTDQLNLSVRQIELDISWLNNDIMICHDNVANELKNILCTGNFSMRSTVAEIKKWIAKNPTSLLIIYLNANMPLAGHAGTVDASLTELDPYIFTPAMATEYYHAADHTLPVTALTQDDLVQKFKKNIIVTTDNDVEGMKASRYMFVNVANTNSTPLYEKGISSFLGSANTCSNTENKYNYMKAAFTDDNQHNNLLRLNATRTVINYVQGVGNKNPGEYTDYFTIANTALLMSCPINIFSTNMLGFTCDSSNCNAHPTDPRMATFLWSWDLGFPLQTNGSDVAYINPVTRHFENAPLQSQASYRVLCLKPSSQAAPTAPLNWFTAALTLTDVSNAYQLASAACQKDGGVFAAPVTSYWLNDVMNMVGEKTNPILINYVNVGGAWVPNGGESLVK